MKKHRLARLCSILLLAALLVSLTVPLASAYSDVTRSAFPDYFDAINYVTDNGLMNGTSTTQFEPNSFVSRAMVVTTLYRMAGSPSSSASVSFTDVSSTDWFYKAVRWSVQYGIANGVTTTTFEPNSMVTREQALTFFLRYLKNFEKRTAYYHYSITYCGDYSQIDSYAVASFRWAVSNGIVYPDSSANNKLYPKSYVYRRELALWLCRYGTNIWGIRHGKDSFRFTNTAANFRSGAKGIERLLISENYYNKLRNLATSANQQYAITDMKLVGWGGVCHGMTMSMLMDKLGKIDLDGTFANNCNDIWDIPAPANVNNAKHKRVLDIRQVEYVSLVENAINFYYLSQNITARFNPQLGGGLWIWPHSGESGKVNWEEALQYDADKTISLQEVVDHQRKSQLTLIGIHYPTTIYTEDYGYELAGTAHSILIYGPPTEAGNYYVFKTYDPNVLSAAKLRISKDYTSCILESTDSSNRVHTTIVEALDYFKNYYYFNCLDLDGDANASPYSVAELQGETENMAYLYVDLVGNSTITNAEGQYLKVGTDGIDGDMEVLNVNHIMYGPGVPETLVLKVRDSASFDLQTDSPYVGFEIVGQNIFANVRGTGINSIRATETQLSIDGKNMDYRASSSCGCTSPFYVVASGTGEDTVALSALAQSVELLTSQRAEVSVVSSADCSFVQQAVKQEESSLYIAGLMNGSPRITEKLPKEGE